MRSVELQWEGVSDDTWAIEAEPRRRGALARALLAVGQSISTAVAELAAGADAQGVVNIIEAGHPSGLIGLSENDWLEAKSQPWNLDSDIGKVELAQDVARLANAGGGVIVLGAATRKHDGEEAIARVHGVRPGLFRPHRVRMTVDARVYPAVEGIRIGRSLQEPSGLVVGYILVPLQHPASLPFLVHGAIVGRRVDGSFMSIVRRRGDQSVAVRAEELHTWLSAGRRLLRGETSTRHSRAP